MPNLSKLYYWFNAVPCTGTPCARRDTTSVMLIHSSVVSVDGGSCFSSLSVSVPAMPGNRHQSMIQAWILHSVTVIVYKELKESIFFEVNVNFKKSHAGHCTHFYFCQYSNWNYRIISIFDVSDMKSKLRWPAIEFWLLYQG